jgi:hypothetical protein
MTNSLDLLLSSSGIDIVGDIHGHNTVLEAALRHLGYESLSGIWRHPDGRRVLFLGDLIDRGPDNRATIATVRDMVDAGEAVCLMGNHELNAVHFSITHPDRSGRHLRPRSDKNLRQHIAFLQEYHLDPAGAEALATDLAWLRTLPLWINHPDFRAVHACWSPEHISHLEPHLDNGRLETEDAWLRTASSGDSLMDAVEVILKGAEIRLPDGVALTDKDGHQREHARVKWWHDGKDEWAESVMGTPELIHALATHNSLPPLRLPNLMPDRPTFFGHYWFAPIDGAPWLAGPTAGGLDFSIARTGGLLGVYRWDGEDVLDPVNLLGFDRNGCAVGAL